MGGCRSTGGRAFRAKACVGHGGYRLLVEGRGKVRRTESVHSTDAAQLQAEHHVDVVNPNTIDSPKPMRRREEHDGEQKLH
jgi:hypothetical protein